MGRRTSIYISDDLDADLRKDGRPLAEILRAGLTPKAVAKRSPRASRIPDDFQVTPEMIAWARENTPSVGRRETEDFIDYWHSASGANARKLDWVATWRNWMRKAEVRSGGTIKSREQRERDAMFDRAMARAAEKEQQHETEGNRPVGEVRRRALPSAEDG